MARCRLAPNSYLIGTRQTASKAWHGVDDSGKGCPHYDRLQWEACHL